MSADSRHNVIIITLFILLLPMVIVLVANMGISPAVFDENQSNALENPHTILTDINNWNWLSLTTFAAGSIAFIAVVVFRLSVGAALFTIAFLIFGTYSINLMHFFEDFGFPSGLTGIIAVGITAIFFYALVRLASN